MSDKNRMEEAVAACEMALNTVARIEKRYNEADIPMLSTRYCQMFALAYVLLNRYMPGVVTKRFALLTLAGTMEIEKEDDAQQLSDAFLKSVDQAESSDELEQMVWNLLGEQHLGNQIVLEELRNLDSQLQTMVSSKGSSGSEEMLSKADQIITACVKFVKDAHEERKRKFSDGKYVQYYACFLAQLVENGLHIGDMGPQFFDRVAQAVGANTPSRRAAMEFKFYRALMTCREQFKHYDLCQAAKRSVAFVEKGRLNAERVDLKVMQIGEKATKILQETIADV